MFKKLQSRILMLNMAVTTLVLIAAFSVVYLTTHISIQRDNREKLNDVHATYMKAGAEYYAPEEDDEATELKKQEAVMKTMTEKDAPSFSVEVDSDGVVASRVVSFIKMPEEMFAEAVSEAWAERRNYATLKVGERLWQYVIIPVDDMKGVDRKLAETRADTRYQIAFLDVTQSQKTLTNLLQIFLCVVMVMLGIIFLFSRWFSARAIMPVVLAWERQRQFVADASHELKTPLSIIGANCDALEANEEQTIASQRKWLGYIRAGSDRMESLVNDLLSLAQLDDAQIRVERIAFDLGEALCEVTGEMAPIFEGHAQQLTLHVQPDAPVTSDRALLIRVMAILLENAAKYAGDGGWIDASFEKNRHRAMITISNGGPGIPAADLPRVFDRFYRVDLSRAGNGGFGLGLPIAKAIIDQLGGQIWAQSTPGERTTFGFSVDI